MKLVNLTQLSLNDASVSLLPQDIGRYTASVLCVHFAAEVICLQCFDTVGWASGRASGL